MSIYFYVYPSAFQNPGGGEIQLLKTKEFLEKRGLQITLYDQWKDKLKKGDLLHVFGSVKYCHGLMRTAQEVGVKLVLSTISWSDWPSALYTYPDWKQRALNILRHTAKGYFPWAPSMRKSMMELADILMPNSQREADQLNQFFKIPRKKIRVIPNGVDAHYELGNPDLFQKKYGLKDFFLCVGRIEPRKNQLALIHAHRGMERPLVLIGEAVSRYQDYEKRCRLEAAANVHFLGYMDNDSEFLRSAYAACDTFVLPSWFETPGLAALEAGLAGSKIVITSGGSTREYFGDDVIYANPHKISNIREAMVSAGNQPRGNRLKGRVRQNYLWEKVAEKVAQAYAELL